MIAAAASGDAEALAREVAVEPVACTTAEGLGGPPKCPQGAIDGALLTRFGVVGCEGGWAEASELAAITANWFAPGIPPSGSDPLSLYAILIIDDRYEGMPGDYYVIFGFPEGQGRALSVTEAGITHLWFGCLPSPVEQWTRPFGSVESRFLLPPLGR